MVLVGDSVSGKTDILNHFTKRTIQYDFTVMHLDIDGKRLKL